MNKYINDFKNKRKKNNTKLKSFISKFLCSLIFLFCSIIYTNIDNVHKDNYINYVFNESIHFTKIEKVYKKIFGRVLPNDTGILTVSSSGLLYKSITKYSNGEELIFDNNSVVSTLMNGIVVYIGNKDEYNNTVIVQGADGYDIWYGNLENISVKLYDYIPKDTVIGNIASNKLYLVIKKDNNYISYEDYKV